MQHKISTGTRPMSGQIKQTSQRATFASLCVNTKFSVSNSEKARNGGGISVIFPRQR